MAEKKYALSFKSGEIASMSVYKSKHGYNYASVGIKRGKDQYMSINYEWEGDKLPDFVMDAMTYFQSEEQKEMASTDAHKEMTEDFNAFMVRLKESTESI